MGKPAARMRRPARTLGISSGIWGAVDRPGTSTVP